MAGFRPVHSKWFKRLLWRNLTYNLDSGFKIPKEKDIQDSEFKKFLNPKAWDLDSKLKIQHAQKTWSGAGVKIQVKSRFIESVTVFRLLASKNCFWILNLESRSGCCLQMCANFLWCLISEYSGEWEPYIYILSIHKYFVYCMCIDYVHPGKLKYQIYESQSETMWVWKIASNEQLAYIDTTPDTAKIFEIPEQSA